MSIIDDALKKAHADLAQNQTPSPAMPNAKEPPPSEKKLLSESENLLKQAIAIEPPKKNPRNKKLGVWIGFFLIITGLLFAIPPYLSKLPLSKKFIFKKTENILPPALKAPIKKKAIPKSSPPPIQLTGIMDMDNKHIALINGNIYTVGDTIEEMRITEIQPKQIMLTHEGKTITLKMEKR